MDIVYTTPLDSLKGKPDEHNISRVPDEELEHAARKGNPAAAFITIDPEMIDAMDDLFEKTPFVRSLFAITMDNVLAGGICIKVGDKYLDNTESSFQQQIWGNWIRDMVRNMWKYGFSFWLIKEDLIGRKYPSVIDMNMVVVKMYLNAASDCRFVLYERGSPSLGAGTHSAPILDARCFCWDRPSYRGELRSKMYAVRGPLQYFNSICTYTIDGIRGQTHPPLVFDPVEAKHNSDDLNYDHLPQLIGRIRRDNDPAAMQVDPVTAAETKRQVATCFALNNAQVAGAHVLSVMETHDSDEQKLTNVIRVPKNYRLTNPNIAQQPREFETFRRMFQEDLASLFGVPVNMFNPQVSTRNGDESSRETFHAKQRILKQQIIEMMTDAFYIINVEESELNALISKDVSDLSSEAIQNTRKNHQIMIELPGIPNDDHMRTLYLEGSLKYEYYRMFMARKLCMPLEAFETTPKISLKDLNGIKPEPIAAATAAATAGSSLGDAKKPTAKKKPAAKKKSSSSSSSSSSSLTEKRKTTSSSSSNTKSKKPKPSD
jgi:hypothetical protein